MKNSVNAAGFPKAMRLLLGYFQMYWLKPFDAVNDAANAVSLLKFDWANKPILEIGGGDGVFSFIMHGGMFNFLGDRYDQADISKKDDMFDIYKLGTKIAVRKESAVKFDLGIDLKLSHLFKSREIESYKYLISGFPEELPVKPKIFKTIFLYTFHGLTDYGKTLKEIKRVIREDGILLALVVNDAVKNRFICFRLHNYFKKIGLNGPADFFLKLDAGRQKEIGEIFAKNLKEWKTLFQEAGFKIEDIYTQVSPFLWEVYDMQTRPLLKILVYLNYKLKRWHLKIVFKLVWICLWMPVLAFFYLFYTGRRIEANEMKSGEIFFAFRAVPV